LTELENKFLGFRLDGTVANAFVVWTVIQSDRRSDRKYSENWYDQTGDGSLVLVLVLKVVRPLSRITTMGMCTPLRACYGAASGMRWWYPRWRRLQEESSTQVLL